MAKKDGKVSPGAMVKANEFCQRASTKASCDRRSPAAAKIDKDASCKWGTLTERREKPREKVNKEFVKTFDLGLGVAKGLAKVSENVIDAAEDVTTRSCWAVDKKMK